MEYKLTKLSVEPDYSRATLWYANPDCIFERVHKQMLFNKSALDILASIISSMGPVDLNDVPIELLPDMFKTIHARYVEVHVGLHKHVSKKVNKQPILTRFIYVFVPQVKCECSGEQYRDLYDPRYLAQEIINRYWIPVDED